jgi:hypothetical protein
MKGFMHNRRHFILAGTQLLIAGRGLSGMLTSSERSPVATLRIRPEETIGPIPTNMMGLSYESTQLGEPDVFSPANQGLISLFKTLSPHGSLRLGGYTGEFTYFKPTDSVQSPFWAPEPTEPPTLTPITMFALRNLRGFLDATGWTCIYGLNIGTGTPERAAEEAEAVTRILGDKLDYFQIGNEPNNFVRFNMRPATWGPDAYVEQWLQFARVIVRRVPQAKLGGPDCYPAREWVKTFSERAKAEMGGHLFELTDHYYAEGPPTSPEATMDNLLHDKRVDESISVMAEYGRIASLPYRMTEVNSCYMGGKPGVSDTLGSGLWAADLTLRLLTSGFCGINFHGGSARQIKAAFGGVMPGDRVANGNATDSYYTPIAGTAALGYTARPIFFGMQLVAKMAGSTLVKTSFASANRDLTAYGALDNNRKLLQIAVFNMGAQARGLTIDLGKPMHFHAATWLAGPAVDATKDIRIVEEKRQRSSLMPGMPGAVHQTAPRELHLTMAPTTAALIQLRESL